MNTWKGTFVIIVLLFMGVKSEDDLKNERPVVGVLAQELQDHLKKEFAPYKSYILVSYVKAVEAAGARVVPVLIGQDDNYYRKLVKRINGVLYPGGDSEMYVRGGYAEAGEKIYNLAIEANNAGDYFPLFGVCLGLLTLMYLSNNKHDPKTPCYSVNDVLPLEFKPDFRDSHLFKNVPDDVVNILQSENVTVNFHKQCVTEANITRFGLDKKWKVLTLNKDAHGLQFVSTVEMRDYPIFAIQFHPEKNVYEWYRKHNTSHTFNAIYSGRHFYDYFVNQTRRSSHKYPEEDIESNGAIQNHDHIYVRKYKDFDFDDIYVFK